MTFSDDLIRKYHIRGPRYTSYPTVPYWETAPTEKVWIQSLSNALDDSEKQGTGSAIYIHIPFCENLCTYCGCNTRISRNHSVARSYITSVLKEWDLYRSHLDRKVTLRELYLGGGTPTFLSPSELEDLVGGILSRVQVPESVDFTLEADPRVTQEAHLRSLYRMGFRSLCLGVEDFDAAVQNVVNRGQTEAEVQTITDQARAIGYSTIRYDLIYGLPLQTVATMTKTMEGIQRLRPNRVAFYGYSHVPWIKAGQRKFTELDLPTEEEKRVLYRTGRELLISMGYREVGLDHFALDSDSIWEAEKRGTLHRNFMGYFSRVSQPLIGLGVSALSDSWTVLSQNEKVLESYQSRVDQGELPILRGHVLSREDLILRKHIFELMTRMETSWNSDCNEAPFLRTVEARLRGFSEDGLIDLNGSSCRVTELGRSFLKNICAAFDARLCERLAMKALQNAAASSMEKPV